MFMTWTEAVSTGDLVDNPVNAYIHTSDHDSEHREKQVHEREII